ncbi:MAG TPA: universal stress protein [Solirubrobacterales bacterium]
MISTVAVGTDGSETAREAVQQAAEFARRFDAKLVLLSAFKDDPPPPDADEVQWSYSPAAQLRGLLSRTEEEMNQQGIPCSTAVEEGDAAEVLVRLAGECDADILVIGSKGMHRRVLGSVPNSVTHKAGCSVLVVKTT